MDPPFPSPFKLWHNDIYPAIDLSRPELSMAGKTVIITGGGSGIGRATALAFAKAGAARVVITGRREEILNEAKKLIEAQSSSTVMKLAADITNAEQMKQVASQIAGGWDVLVNNAGYLPAPSPGATADMADWWKGFEINVKGTMIVAQTFFPAAKEGAVFIGTSTSAFGLPPQFCQGLSSYMPAKLAQLKIYEILAAETKHISIRCLHPGIIETDLGKKSGLLQPGIPIDKGHFTVWLATPEAAFLAGRVASCNFDIDELKSFSQEIASGRLFQTDLHGVFGPGLTHST